jgi:hypothetical protein
VHLVYAAMRARVALDSGLHGIHSAAEACPAERPTQGLRRSVDEGRRGWAEALGCHGPPQPKRWLKVASEHVAILVARGGDD